MPKIETPRKLVRELRYKVGGGLDSRRLMYNYKLSEQEAAARIAARDAAIRTESAKLLRVCGEALGRAQILMMTLDIPAHASGSLAVVNNALAALKNAGVL